MTKKSKKETEVQIPENRKTALQRIDDLEQKINALIQRDNELLNLISEQDTKIQALARKLKAVIQAGESGSISNDLVDNVLINDAVNKMKNDVNVCVQQGFLVQADVITEKSFIVGRELDGEKNVSNPRWQFSFSSMGDQHKSDFLGKKTGDIIVSNEEDSSVWEITEIYNIVEPKNTTEEKE
jgi:hypothetical protein